MSPSKLSLPAQVLAHYDEAIAQGHINIYTASSVTPLSSPSTFPHLLHVCPDLATKPAVPLKTPNLHDTPTRDPFSGPSYGPGDRERALDLSTGQHTVVHNLFALMSEHEMIVPSFGEGRPFRPQTSDLLEPDFEAAWEVVSAYAEEGREVIMFFNGGPLAGASQPHLHMQYCPFQRGPPGPEAVARSLLSPPPPSTPIILDLPWLSFYAALPSSPTISDLTSIYHSLIAASKTYLSTRIPAADLPPVGVKRDSYNLFLTISGMHLIPRTERVSLITRKASAKEGDEVLRMSINGLPLLGLWHCGSEEAVQDLIEFGVERVLRESCHVNQDYKA